MLLSQVNGDVLYHLFWYVILNSENGAAKYLYSKTTYYIIYRMLVYVNKNKISRVLITLDWNL